MQERNLVVKTASSDRSKTNPETGRELVKKHKNALEAVIRGHDVIVITCALGGSIGSGAAPVIAAMAKELGVMIIAAVILPTRMETDNSQKGKVVDDALAGLILPAGTVIMVSNQEVFEQCDANMTVKQAYKKADDILIDKIGGAVAAKAARHLKGLKDRIN
jgi:cell division protein FtsZ